ncbi:MAG TPA: hypothetical protein VMA36_13780 [Candidatus Limnocylindria bacterium]|jgi:hypothetical protein|nr:hypothetical protein [Candidatus Limnocylindria bacterium]
MRAEYPNPSTVPDIPEVPGTTPDLPEIPADPTSPGGDPEPQDALAATNGGIA